MRRSPAALALLLAACTVREVPGDSTTTGTTAVSSTSAGTSSIPTSTSSTTSTSTPTTDTPDPGTTTTPTLPGFIAEPDLPPDHGIQCDGLKQLEPECPSGQKCTIDGSLTATHCVDIVDDPKGLYEPCTMQGDAWSGVDDCALGMLCWNVDERGHGICVGLCDASSGECECVDPKANVTFCQECAVGLCLPGCDPLLQDCDGDDLCIPNADQFVCAADASRDEGQTNDPCEFPNGCDKGLVCLDPKIASSACAQRRLGCCQPLCEFIEGQPSDCPNPDQKCLQWFSPMMPIPPGLEDVGVCAIPP